MHHALTDGSSALGWTLWVLSWVGWLLWQIVWLIIGPIVLAIVVVFIASLVRFFQVWHRKGLAKARAGYWQNTSWMYLSLWWLVRTAVLSGWRRLTGAEANEPKEIIKVVEKIKWRRMPMLYIMSTRINELLGLMFVCLLVLIRVT